MVWMMKLSRLPIGIAAAWLTIAAAGEDTSQRQLHGSHASSQRNLPPRDDVSLPVPSRLPATPAAPEPPAPSPAGPPSRPDERPLWRLLAQQRDTAFRAEVAQLKRRYPSWQPPARMLELASMLRRKHEITAALAAGPAAAITRLAARYSREFGCEHPDRVWKWAQLLAAEGDIEGALAAYHRLVPQCPRSEDRLATLYEAIRHLPAAADALVEEERAHGLRDAIAQARLDELLYQRRRDAIIAAHQQRAGNALTLAESLRSALIKRRDSDVALVLGWAALDALRFEEASQWFGLAREWAPRRVDAIYGLALAQMKMGDSHAALATLEDSTDSRASTLRGDIWIMEAVRLQRARDYRGSLAALERAASVGRSDADSLQLAGWNHLNLGDADAAVQAFSASFARRPDAEGAGAWTRALRNAGRRHELVRLASDARPEVAQAARQVLADDAYDHKLFLLSKSEHGRPSLQAVDAPALLGMVEMHRQLQQPGGRYELEPRSWIVGSRALGTQDVLRIYAAHSGDSASRDAVRDAVVEIEHQAWTNWRMRLGRLSSDLLGARLYGEAQWRRLTSAGEWQVSLFEQPVRETRQSELGTNAPIDGATWGGVNRAGVSGTWRHQWSDLLSSTLSADTARYIGTRVANNHGRQVSAALAFNLAERLPGNLDYFTVGPRLSGLGFTRNQNHPTYGHGGYFSPADAVSFGAGADWQTHEGRAWLARGGLALGMSRHTESTAPCYPQGPPAGAAQCLDYAAHRTTGMYAHAKISAVRLLAQAWQTGATASYGISPGYHDARAVLFVRFVWGKRAAVFSADLAEP